MKRFITLLFLFLIILNFSGCRAEASVYTINYQGKEYGYDDIKYLEDLINLEINNMNAAHEMAEAARELGYLEDNPIIETAQSEYVCAQQEIDKINLMIENLTLNFNNSFKDKESEYPYATQVWKSLKQEGFNDYVCAGIMGNLMTEVGGQTLNLNPYAYSSNGNYYGICQWSKAYIEIWEQDLISQCNFLNRTMKYEFDTYGNKYKNNFDFEKFKKLKNEKDAALAFAKCYERCGSASYKIRQQNAEKAYEYFVK